MNKVVVLSSFLYVPLPFASVDHESPSTNHHWPSLVFIPPGWGCYHTPSARNPPEFWSCDIKVLYSKYPELIIDLPIPKNDVFLLLRWDRGSPVSRTHWEDHDFVQHGSTKNYLGYPWCTGTQGMPSPITVRPYPRFLPPLQRLIARHPRLFVDALKEGCPREGGWLERSAVSRGLSTFIDCLICAT